MRVSNGRFAHEEGTGAINTGLGLERKKEREQTNSYQDKFSVAKQTKGGNRWYFRTIQNVEITEQKRSWFSLCIVWKGKAYKYINKE